MFDSQRLQLVPHPTQKMTAPNAVLTASVRSSRAKIQAEFIFESSSALIIPNLKLAQPGRHDELWKATCFELFLQPEGEAKYWEINVSPLGDWNVYAFSNYREGMQPESRVRLERAPELAVNENMCVCNFSLDLSALNVSHLKVQVGITAVIEVAGGNKSYWAIRHASDKPDFHKSESFAYQIVMGN